MFADRLTRQTIIFVPTGGGRFLALARRRQPRSCFDSVHLASLGQLLRQVVLRGGADRFWICQSGERWCTNDGAPQHRSVLPSYATSVSTGCTSSK